MYKSTKPHNFLPFEDVYRRLTPLLENLETKRKNWRLKENLLLAIPTLGVVMIGIGLHYYEVDPETRVPTWSMLFLTMLGIFVLILGLMGRMKRMYSYKSFFREELTQAVVETIDPSIVSRPNSFIERVTFLRANFFHGEKPKDYYGRNLIFGKRGATDFRLCEINIGHSINKPVFSKYRGLFFEADFHKYFKGKTLVLPKDLLNLDAKFFNPLEEEGGEAVIMENPFFAKKFNVFTTDPVEARYILSTRMLADIVDLQQRFKCKVYVSFKRDRMYLGINWNKDIFGTFWSKPATSRAQINQYYDDLILCLDLVDDLNLNTRIWSKRPT